MGKRKPVMKAVSLELEAGDLEWLEAHVADRGISVERYPQRLVDLAHRQDNRRRETASRYVLQKD